MPSWRSLVGACKLQCVDAAMQRAMMERPGGLRTCNEVVRADKPMQYVAVHLWVHGDWKSMQFAFVFPTWNSVAGMCWRCSCNKHTLRDIIRTAPWGHERRSHGVMIQCIVESGKTLSPLLASPYLELH